jgi:hypothetical protein
MLHKEYVLRDPMGSLVLENKGLARLVDSRTSDDMVVQERHIVRRHEGVSID